MFWAAVGVLGLTVFPGGVTGTRVDIDSTHPLTDVEPYFLSYAVDAYLLAQTPRWLNFDFGSKKLRSLMRGLAPALLRFGGSPADWTIFADDVTVLKYLNASGDVPSISVFTKEDLDNMVDLTLSTGNRFLFDLDLQLRYGKQWDPTNALQMMQYMQSKNYGENIDFELGNEPGSYNKPGQIANSGDQVGGDFLSLAKLVRSFPNLNNSSIVGPDVVGTKPGSAGLKILKGVLNHAGPMMKAATFHHYYIRGDTAHVKDYLDPVRFADLERTIATVWTSVRNTTSPRSALWIGETADAWHGGTPNVTDRFASAFLWLDKLGVCARENVTTVMRQTLYGHNYGLLNDSLEPNPDYWLSLLHKRLVGQRVLSVRASFSPNTTRVYAHCTSASLKAPPGSVTLFALNVKDTAEDVLWLPEYALQPASLYLMSAPHGDISSKSVELNGRELRLGENYELPETPGRPVTLTDGLVLPPLTYAFLVLPQATASACTP